MISHQLNRKQKEFVLAFEADAISTTVDQMQAELETVVSSSSNWNEQWETLTLDMRLLQMIDSLGLNLLVSLIKRANNRDIKIRTLLRSRMVYQTLLATRMDKQMSIHLEE